MKYGAVFCSCLIQPICFIEHLDTKDDPLLLLQLLHRLEKMTSLRTILRLLKDDVDWCFTATFVHVIG